MEESPGRKSVRLLCGVVISVSTNSGGLDAFERFARLENLEISSEQGSWADLMDSRIDVRYVSAIRRTLL
jgi:hypothetical protein